METACVCFNPFQKESKFTRKPYRLVLEVYRTKHLFFQLLCCSLSFSKTHAFSLVNRLRMWKPLSCDSLWPSYMFLEFPTINIWTTFHLLLSVQSPKLGNWHICVGKITTVLDAWNNSEFVLVVTLASMTLWITAEISYSQDTAKFLMQTATVIPPPKCPQFIEYLILRK